MRAWRGYVRESTIGAARFLSMCLMLSDAGFLDFGFQKVWFSRRAGFFFLAPAGSFFAGGEPSEKREQRARAERRRDARQRGEEWTTATGVGVSS